MFTSPEVRGQGVAKALMHKSIKRAMQDAQDLGKEYVGSVVVDSDNPSALSLYHKFGYVTIGEEPRSPGNPRKACLMKYSPDDRARSLVL